MNSQHITCRAALCVTRGSLERQNCWLGFQDRPMYGKTSLQPTPFAMSYKWEMLIQAATTLVTEHWCTCVELERKHTHLATLFKVSLRKHCWSRTVWQVRDTVRYVCKVAWLIHTTMWLKLQSNSQSERGTTGELFLVLTVPPFSQPPKHLQLHLIISSHLQ